MADIDVVKKQGGNAWLMWLLLAIAAVVIAWMMLGRNDEPARTSQLSFEELAPRHVTGAPQSLLS